jgi:integrase
MRVESIVQPEGEELVLLLDGDEMPIPIANEWLLTRRGRAGGTLVRNARELAPLFEWVNNNDVNLRERLFLGRGFTEAEIAGSLIESLRRDRRKLTRVKKLAVSPDTFNKRLDTVQNFLKWCFSVAVSGSHDNERLVERIRTSRDQVMLWFSNSHMNSEPTKNLNKSITPKQEISLLEALDPKGLPSTSLYKRALQSRNFVTAILSLFCGLRRGEALCLRVEDIVTSSPIPQVNVRRRAPDIKDKRQPRPSVKRNGRVLPLDPFWARAVDDYITEWRDVLQERGNEESEYLLLSSNGKPLSTSGYNKVFRVVREKNPDSLPASLTPHSLRYAFSNNMLQQLIAAGLPEDEARRQLAILRGDSSESSQDVYVANLVSERASRQLLSYQQGYAGVHEDVPF